MKKTKDKEVIKRFDAALTEPHVVIYEDGKLKIIAAVSINSYVLLYSDQPDRPRYYPTLNTLLRSAFEYIIKWHIKKERALPLRSLITIVNRAADALADPAKKLDSLFGDADGNKQ